MMRRLFLSRIAQLGTLPFASAGGSLGGQTARKPLKIMMKSAWGSDDPTKSAFPFLHGLALAEAGHEVQIFLLGGGGWIDAKDAGQRSDASGMAACGARRWTRLLRNTFRFTHAVRALVPEA
jgi:hypothetical protein